MIGKPPTPIEVVAKIVSAMRNRFPQQEESIFEWQGPLIRTADQDRQLAYKAPGIAIAMLPIAEPPVELDPWNMRLMLGAVVVNNAPEASARHVAGWNMAWAVATMIYRNCWGYSHMHITPAKIVTILKTTPVTKDGIPLAIDYWTVQFYHDLQLDFDDASAQR